MENINFVENHQKITEDFITEISISTSMEELNQTIKRYFCRIERLRLKSLTAS